MIRKVTTIFKKKWFWVVIVLVGLGIGAKLIFGNKSESVVNTTTVQKGEVKEELILSGQVKADKYAALSFPTYGKISWVGVAEGDTVRQGTALTSLDKTTLNATYMQALNTYKSYQAAAESTLDSVKDHDSDETFAQKATRTAAEVARDNAYDAVQAAEYNLKNSTLYAPFSGLISSLPFPSPGVNVSLGQTQVEIVDPASIYFEVQADQNEVTEVKEDQEVTIVLDSFKDKKITGKVVYIGYTPVTGEASTVYKIKIEFDKESLGDTPLRVGMSGDAKFTLSKKEDVLFIPVDYLHSDRDGKYVSLGKKGNKNRVEVGVEGEETVEILSGVKEGDVVYE